MNNKFLGTPSTPHGVDISHHNGLVQMAALRAAGISFAFVKCADGAFNTDDRYIANTKQAHQANILVAPYLFVRATQDPVKQADHLIANTDSHLVVLDLEWDKNRPEQPDNWQLIKRGDDRVAHVGELILRIREKLGRLPIIYTQKSFWDPTFGQATGHKDLKFADCPLWAVDVNPVFTNPRLALPWNTWTFRQCGIGSVSGPGLFDLDVFNGSAEQLQKFFQG